jgi:hypothetical protein
VGPDYFTDLEVEDIRAAQEIELRTEVLLGIAERRLGALDLLESDLDDPQAKPGVGGRIGRVLIRIFNPEAAEQLEAAETERAALEHDLSGHSRADLLHGYHQALEEAMDNIDDAYERDRGDVRTSVEAVREFTRITLDYLRSAETQSESEKSALGEAIEQTRIAHEGAGHALEMLSRDEP